MQFERVLRSLWSPSSSGDKNTASSEKREIILTSVISVSKNKTKHNLQLWAGSKLLPGVSETLMRFADGLKLTGCKSSIERRMPPISFTKLLKIKYCVYYKCVMRRDCRLLRPQRFYSTAPLHRWEQLEHYRAALHVFSAASKRYGRSVAKNSTVLRSVQSF